MSEADSTELTALLSRMGKGDRSASDQLFGLVYEELRRIARGIQSRGDGGRTLQPTALVHEAYLRLVGEGGAALEHRRHFFAVAARAMRQTLTDHARRRNAVKRGGGWERVTLDQSVAVTATPEVDVLALDEALTRLKGLDERKTRVVELRFFSGLTNEEAAEVLGVSRATVADDWAVARAWLRGALGTGSSEP